MYKSCLIAAVVLCSASAVFALEQDTTVDQGQCLPMQQLTALSFQPTVTTGRKRGPNVPTMTCVGNCPAHVLLGAQCSQTGLSDNGLPSWRCVGQFQQGNSAQTLSLGTVRVVCEGCQRAGDPNVRMNSCALQYSVNVYSRRGGGHHHHEHSEVNSLLSEILLVIMIVAAITMCLWCRRQQEVQYVPISTPAGVVPGYPAYPAGYPSYYGGGMGTGLGTGMFMGMMMGDAMSHHHHYHDSGYGGGDGGYGGSSYGGDAGGGFGGSDSV